ncbi:MaoC family dehydratase [Limibaculum sp. M0105]|uniref:MaoC family dehydratase n=1 Tax=Thermohalobaculum xanthum TaxID=2753746 RepID=A0A8J7M6P1_9RHOB|nr:MaoC family dehydratase [Thermohalobaculum xanthum]MBK0398842.1 MaoC family dehydratase [Thermohalobaculum xanthum]
MREIAFEEIPGLVGQEICLSDWLEVDQAMIDRFAAATGDHQWIHVDVPRATAEIGGTIAHGYLTLSLIPRLAESRWRLRGEGRRINYGLDRLRFITPVPSGGRVRLRQTLAAVEPSGEGLRLAIDSVMELDGAARPAFAARNILLIFPG